MAESKNTFFKAKMNKDLDVRLLESSEYRDALNISVGKSEDGSVGSLQNILGNELLTQATSTGTAPFESNTNLVCIGFFIDNDNSRIFQFLTEYTDPSPSLINLPTADKEMKITVYSAGGGSATYTTLVSGSFLNLSTTNLITGVNLVENLLFWTDNRNQPRKINVASALNNPATSANPYYTNVDQISVAKYAPFRSPTLYEEVSITTEDVPSEFYLGQTIIQVPAPNTLALGDQLVNEDLDPAITAGDFACITKKDTIIADVQPIYIAGNHTIPANTTLKFYRTTMTTSANEDDINGNDTFLTDKFVRFSYRFKFDDNEYSLMAPFTQPIFIPLQKGYFISGDEDAAYASTVLEWMQNKANGVRLQMELPDIGSDIQDLYKIISMDILYKESDSLAVKVVQTIPVANIQQDSPNTNIYTYTYNSQKPKKTLQEAETIRVYDKVPTRALAQESSGNRIIYGNFINQSTPPVNLDYNVQVIEKNTPRTSWYEYPNHTLKQNRSYQVGVVLADKFGRQSSVILSNGTPFAPIEGLIFGASSVFLPYKGEFWDIKVKEWLGEVLAITFNSTITSVRNETTGTPGLYATVSGSLSNSSDGFEVIAPTSIVGNVYDFTLKAPDLLVDPPIIPQRNHPAIGNFLKGKYTDYVEVIDVTFPSDNRVIVTTDKPISDLYAYNDVNDPDIKYSYSINELGWYSYKIVVKQTDQEYYNVYVPGMLAGYPVWQTFKFNTGTMTGEYTVFPENEEESTCHFALLNDNINKVPRDLSEVGPNQKQYRSSVKLWGRVENVLLNPNPDTIPVPDPLPETTNRQYYPGKTPDTVSTIAPSNDLDFLINSTELNPRGSAAFNIYQLNTSPLIARVSTINQVGVIGNYSEVPASPNAFNAMSPFLGVYETDPVKSMLDIFYETSTADYISNLNWDINVGSNGVAGVSPITFIYNENQPLGEDDFDLETGTIDSSWVTDEFWFTDASGTIVEDIDSVSFQVRNNNPDILASDVTNHFELVKRLAAPSVYRIKITDNSTYFGTNRDELGTFRFRFIVTNTVEPDTYIIELNAESPNFKISNAEPTVTRPVADDITYFVPINQPYVIGDDPITIIDPVGVNGCSSDTFAYSGRDLYWSLAPVEPLTPLNFIMEDRSTGDIRLGSLPQEGVAAWNINLQDSTTSTGVAQPEPNPGDPPLGSLNTTRAVNFDVENRSLFCANIGLSWSPFPTFYRLVAGSTTFGPAKFNIARMLKQGEEIATDDFGNPFGYNLIITGYMPQSGSSFLPTNTVNLPRLTIQSGDPIGVFTIPAFINGIVQIPLSPPPEMVKKIKIEGYVTIRTADGGTRLIDQEYIVDLVSTGGVVNSEPSRCVTCKYFPTGSAELPAEPPYISDTEKDWMIHNTSTVNVWWRGVRADNEAIIGGRIAPDNIVASTGNVPPGIFPKVREGSLRVTGQGLDVDGNPSEDTGILATVTYYNPEPPLEP
jgi:hypothetical protein